MLYAGIDIGSNAVRLLICESRNQKRSDLLKKILFVRVPVRLGEDLNDGGKISNEKRTKLKHTLSAFSNLLLAYDVKCYRACATASLRLASNGNSISKYISQNCNIEIEIISGKKEAELIHSIHHPQIMKSSRTYLCMDVGGGSTELTLIRDQQILALESFPVGTLYLRHKTINIEIKNQIKNWILENCGDNLRIQLIGTGGNINCVAKLLGKKIQQAISKEEIEGLMIDLSSLKLKQRMETYQLREDRADVILPALNLYLMVMGFSNATKIFVPKTGLADGIIYSMLK